LLTQVLRNTCFTRGLLTILISYIIILIINTIFIIINYQHPGTYTSVLGVLSVLGVQTPLKMFGFCMSLTVILTLISHDKTKKNV